LIRNSTMKAAIKPTAHHPSRVLGRCHKELDWVVIFHLQFIAGDLYCLPISS
jgi:hypothetical protein